MKTDTRIPWSEIKALYLPLNEESNQSVDAGALCVAANLDRVQLDTGNHKIAGKSGFQKYDIIITGGYSESYEFVGNEAVLQDIIRSEVPCWAFGTAALLFSLSGQETDTSGHLKLTPAGMKDPVFSVLPEPLPVSSSRGIRAPDDSLIPLITDGKGITVAYRYSAGLLYASCFSPLVQKELLLGFIRTYIAWPEFLA